MNYDTDPSSADALLSGVSPASQTLVRGLDVLEQVADGPVALSALARQLGLSRSTVHRLATTLLERRYLNITPRRGYSLGPKLLELGFVARDQISLVRLARPHLEALAAQTGDVAVLAVPDGNHVLVADRAAGRRPVLPSLRTGDRLALSGATLGEAMRAADGIVVDVGEAEIRTVAAPVRGADGTVRAVVAIAVAAVYAEDARRGGAAAAVLHAATEMSAELGWQVCRPHATVNPAAHATGIAAAHELRTTMKAAAKARAGAGAAMVGVSGATDERERDRMGGPRA
jgi:DNA-binding IclR family transcriptional regulator